MDCLAWRTAVRAQKPGRGTRAASVLQPLPLPPHPIPCRLVNASARPSVFGAESECLPAGRLNPHLCQSVRIMAGVQHPVNHMFRVFLCRGFPVALRTGGAGGERVDWTNTSGLQYTSPLTEIASPPPGAQDQLTAHAPLPLSSYLSGWISSRPLTPHLSRLRNKDTCPNGRRL